MNPVNEKILLITGATAGIGEACAEVFAEQGARLILCARRSDRLEQLTMRLQKNFHSDILPVTLDIRRKEQVEEAINGLPEPWRNIDILINNAGLARGLDKIHEADIGGWEEMIDTNIKGLLYISRAVIPGMVQRGRGHIVNLGSIAGHEVYPGGNVYCATKHAVHALNNGMLMDLVDTPIRVTSIDPGMVETEFSQVRFYGDTQRAQKVYEGIQALSGRDIAEIILFVVTRPSHVNIRELIVMPTHQASALVVHRQSNKE